MVFERGHLYWLPKNGTVVEYIGASAGGQQNVTDKVTGDPLTVLTADLAPLDEAAYNQFMEAYEKRGGIPMSEMFEQPAEVRGSIAADLQTIFPDFTLASEDQFEDWRDNRFHMRNTVPPEVAEAEKADNTMYWVIGGILALVLVNNK